MEEIQQTACRKRRPLRSCPQCHQPVLPTYYFCPNCGKSLHEPPLSTTVGAQTGLYALSIIMPMICFLAINQWRGMKYMKSADPQAKQIGYYRHGAYGGEHGCCGLGWYYLDGAIDQLDDRRAYGRRQPWLLRSYRPRRYNLDRNVDRRA